MNQNLVSEVGGESVTPCYFATIEDIFDFIKRDHIATGHGGHDPMLKELCPNDANILHGLSV